MQIISLVEYIKNIGRNNNFILMNACKQNFMLYCETLNPKKFLDWKLGVLRLI